jgi:hypothetical protein
MAKGIDIGVGPRTEAELRAIVLRFEEKWQRRRRAHRIVGFVL